MENNLTNKDKNLILALFLAGLFMGALDGGIIGPALPVIQKTFNLNTRLSSWMYTAFILFFMLGSPIMAKLSDFHGRRNLYMIDIGIFAVGSLLISLAMSFEFVLIGRALQGFAAGGIYPVASAFIGDYFPPDTRGKALGMVGSVFGISTICSPLLGALLLSYGWQWLFIINLPIACIIIGISFLILPRVQNNLELKVDWLGIGILAIIVTNLAYGVNQIDSSRFFESFLSINVLPHLLIVIILIPLLWKIEKKVKEPIIPIHLLYNSEIRLASSLSFSYGIIQTTIIFIPSLAIIALFLNSQEASLIMLPFAIVTSISAPIIGALLDKLGSRILIVSGTLVLFCGLIIMVFFSQNIYMFIISEILSSYGLLTIIGSPLRYIILSETPPGERGSGQAIVNILSSAGQLIGGALIGAIIASYGGKLFGYSLTYFLVSIVTIFAFISGTKLKNRKNQLIAIEKNL